MKGDLATFSKKEVNWFHVLMIFFMRFEIILMISLACYFAHDHLISVF